MKYVLKGDIPEYNYQIFGVYSNRKNMFDAANKVFKHNSELTKLIQPEYGYSGLVYYEFDTMDNDPNPISDERPKESLIYYDPERNDLYLQCPRQS